MKIFQNIARETRETDEKKENILIFSCVSRVSRAKNLQIFITGNLGFKDKLKLNSKLF